MSLLIPFLHHLAALIIGAQTRISQAMAKMVQYPERLKLFTGYMNNMPRIGQ